jgi:membrane-bound lytic murein transglycosylase MltF
LKLPSRITTLVVLLSAHLLGSLALPGAPSRGPTSPFLAPASPDTLRKHGALRFSVPQSSRASDVASRGSTTFDYDLLGRFASDLGVSLIRRETPSEEAAAELLRSGLVDVAVLRSVSPNAPDMIQVEACSGGQVLGVFLRVDSPELAEAVSGFAGRLASLDDDSTARFCSRTRRPAGEDQTLPLAGQISRYAHVIAKYAGAAGLDWRLVAAIIFEESSFEPKAVSARGAMGLMQLMPATSAEIGFKNISEPEVNIQAGVLYLRKLSDQFPNVRASDRLAMVLAAYLLGPGHVLDAQDLARDLGLSSRRWHHGLEETLPLLEDERFHSKTRLGYARGQQAVVYVNRILDRYDLYRKHLSRKPELRASAEPIRPAA